MEAVLHYMTTIHKLLSDGVLEEFILPDWERRSPKWKLYATSGFFQWVDSTPELDSPALKIGGRLRVEHLEQFLCDMRCSARPPCGDVRRVQPVKHGVWKLHPEGLRIFGFYCETGTFIAVHAELVEATKVDKSLVDKCRNKVRAWIKKAGLEESVVYGDISAIYPV